MASRRAPERTSARRARELRLSARLAPAPLSKPLPRASLLLVSLSDNPEAPPPPFEFRDAAECTHGSVPHPEPHRSEPPSGAGSQSDFYLRLRKNIRAYLKKRGPFRYADILLVGPDLFHLLVRLVGDKRIPTFEKAKLGATIAYFVSPIGLIPEGVTGPIGYLDDIALSAYVLRSLLGTEYAPIVREHWAGERDVLDVVQGVLEGLDHAMRGGLWDRLKKAPRPPK